MKSFIKKTILLITTTLSISFVYSQEVQNIKPLPIEQKILLDSISKNDLYNNFIVWVGRNFNSSSVIQTQNQETGTIIVKFILNCNTPTPNNPYSADFHTYCHLEINCKDGKYRLIFSNIVYVTSLTTVSYESYLAVVNENRLGKKQAYNYLTGINNEISNLVKRIESDMISFKIDKKSDW
jgi:hypothetical protein